MGRNQHRIILIAQSTKEQRKRLTFSPASPRSNLRRMASFLPFFFAVLLSHRDFVVVMYLVCKILRWWCLIASEGNWFFSLSLYDSRDFLYIFLLFICREERSKVQWYVHYLISSYGRSFTITQMAVENKFRALPATIYCLLFEMSFAAATDAIVINEKIQLTFLQ